MDRAEYGPKAAGETRIGDEVERDRLNFGVDGHRDEVVDRYKTGLVSPAPQKTDRRAGELARREPTR